MTFTEVKDWFELLSYVVTIVGFPLAIYVFYREREKEIDDNKERALADSADRYVAFLELIVNYPKFDLFSIPHKKSVSLTDEEIKVEGALIAILIDMFEKAYLLYHDENDCIQSDQWLGWVGTITSYTCRDNFQREWNLVGEQFDSHFYQYIEGLIAQIEQKNS